MSIRRTIRSGIAAILVCGSLVALAGLLPRAGILIAPANAAAGVRTVTTVCAWNDLEWKDLNGAEQAAWRVLGWRPDTWGSDDPAMEPEALSKDWTELSPTERQAAELLGYKQQNWNIDPDPCDGQ
jgi:hypothetical protein